MNIKNLILPKGLDADIDTEKKRAEIRFKGDNTGQIIAYFPIDNLQLYCYSINGDRFPDMWDLGLRVQGKGQYLRVLICKQGHGEFYEKSVKYNMSGGEFGLKFSKEEKNVLSVIPIHS